MENINIDLQSPNINNVNDVLTGPQGPKGEPGEPGRDGVSPTINIGETNTLDAGTPASVTNVGSDTNVILNFGIPQGPQGEQGEPGENGADGTDGVSPTITIGSTYTLDPDQSASVTNVGTDTDLILNFGIPQGKQGTTEGCLSTPTIVDSLPSPADPSVFYFVPKSYTNTTVTGDNISLTFTDSGRISTLSLQGYLDASLQPLTGNVDIEVDGETTTIPLDSTWLAKVNTTYDEIVNDGTNWSLIRRIGYIESYDGETITTDYVCTSGTLTTGDEVYYVLDEPETIEIDNPDITGPLNSIRTYTYATGTVTIETTANVTANLEIKYHSFDINNQFDKYVYVIDTANWEIVNELPITTKYIADEAVTKNKIDWSTIETPPTSGVYSATEQIVGTWNNKTLYRILLTGTISLTNGTTGTVNGPSGVDDLVSMKGWWRCWGNNDSGNFMPFGQNLDNNNYSYGFKKGSDNIATINFKSQFTHDATYCVSIEYTKL